MKSLFRLLIAGLGSVIVALSQSKPPLNPPPQARGYHLVFSEDFSSFDLSPNGYGTHQWYPGIYFDAAMPPASSISVIDSAVSKSTLHLQWNRASGQTNTSIEGCAYKAGNCNTYRYGYFEARMKWDVTTGAWPAFWMGTEQSVWGEAHVGEIDIFEGQGNDPTHYYGTINEWNGPNDLVWTNSPSSNRFQIPPGNSFSGWHTYGLLWVPGKVSWYFDNVQLGSAATPSIFDQQDFFIMLGSQEGNHWLMGNLTDVTARSLNLDVDWVHVYQAPLSPPLTALQQTTNLFAHPPALTLLTTTLPNPNSMQPYAVEPQAAGGTPPYLYSIKSGSLPAGLNLRPTTGMISSTSGTSIAPGPYRFTLEVTDALNAIATRTYSGVVEGVPPANSYASFPLSSAAIPNGITNGPEENLWFTAMGNAGTNLIGHISTAGVITTIDSPNPALQNIVPPVPIGGDITASSAGKLWATQPNSRAIFAIDPVKPSQSTYYPPSGNAVPTQIIGSQDGTIWYTDSTNSRIGSISAAGGSSETPTPSPNSYPLGLVEGPQNLIVFTEPGVNKIGFVAEAGTRSGDYLIPTRNSYPTSIVLGPDNAFWFTENRANKIGRIDYNANITETAIPAAPGAITLGPDGALYFTEPSANRIGRITIGGQVTEIAIPGANSGPVSVVEGPDGNLWFTESSLSRIGKIGIQPGSPIPAKKLK